MSLDLEQVFGTSTGPTGIPGLITPGTFDPKKRPRVPNPDGTYSTIRTITITEDGHAVLLPTVINGKVVSPQEAVQHYHQTKEHLGIFDTEQNAEAYDRQLHQEIEPGSYERGAARSAPLDLETVFGGGAGVQPPTEDEMLRVIAQKAQRFGVPIEVALAIWHAEGGRRDPRVRGSSGEVGPFQLMPETFRGIMGASADPSNIDQNVEAGIRYLRQNYDRFKSWPLAAAAYNAGGGAVSAGKIPQSTKNTYMPRFLQYWDTFRKDPGHAVKRVMEELGRVGPQAFASGLTLGAVPMPKAAGGAQQVAGVIGETVGSIPPFLVGGEAAGALRLVGPLRTAGAMGLMGAGRGGIEVAKGEAPVSEIPLEAAREAAIGLTGDIVLRLAMAPIVSLARRLGILPQKLADDIANEGNRTAQQGETQEQAVRRVMANLASGLHVPEGTGRVPLGPTETRPPATAPLFERPGGPPPPSPVAKTGDFGGEPWQPPEQPLLPADTGRPPGPIITPAPDPRAEYERSPGMRQRIATLARAGGIPEGDLARQLTDQATQRQTPLDSVVRAVEQRMGLGEPPQAPVVRPAAQEDLDLPMPTEEPVPEPVVTATEPVPTAAVPPVQETLSPAPGSFEQMVPPEPGYPVTEPKPVTWPSPDKPVTRPHPAVPPARKAGDVPTTVGAGDAPKNAVAKLRAQLKSMPGSTARLQAERIINAARQALVDAKGSPPEAVQAFREAITGETPFNMLDDDGAQSVVLAVRRGGLTFQRASLHVEGPSPLVLTAAELAQRASTEMPAAIATQIDRMAQDAEAVMLRESELVDRAVGRRTELDPRTGVVKQRQADATIRDHEYMAEQARQYAEQMRERIQWVREQGVELPPLEPLPSLEQFQVTLRAADPASLEQLRGDIERASRVVQDANNRLADISGGSGVAPEHATGSANHYLVMLAKQTRDLGEMARLLERRDQNVPTSFLEALRQALGTQNLGIVGPGTQEFVDLLNRSGIAKTVQSIGMWVKAVVYPGQGIIKQVPAGHDFIEALDLAERDEAQGLGKLIAPYEAYRRLSLEERQNVMRAIEGRAAPMNERTAQQVQVWKQYFGQTAQALQDAQFKTFDPDRMAVIDEIRVRRQQGENIPFPEGGPWREFHPRNNFWPHSIRRELLDARANESVFRGRLVRHYRNQGFDDVEAQAKANFDLTSIRRQRGVRYGHVEMARTTDLPEFMREPPERELARYIMQVERAKALASHFGTHDPVRMRLTGEPALTWTGAELYFDRIGKEAVEQGLDRTPAQLAERTFRIYAGEGALDDLDQRLKRAAVNINQATVIANMGLSTLWKLTQPFTNAPLRTSWRAFAEGLIDVVRPGGIAAQRESGAIIDDVFHDVIGETEYAQGANRWARKFLTLNGFIPAVRWSRAVAAASGKRYARQLFNRLASNPRDAFARRQLEEILGPNELQQALGRGAMTVQDYNNAGFTIARDVEFIGRSDRYPMFWASPWGQLASLFHRFTFQQSQFIFRHIVGEAAKGNIIPLAITIPAWFAIGDSAQSLMAQIRGKKRPFVLGELYDWLVLGHAPEESTQQLLRSMTESTVGWAVMGFWGDIARNMTSNTRLLELATGPAISEATQATYHAVQAFQQELQIRNLDRPADRRTAADAFLRDLTRHIPVLGPRMADEIRTPHERYILTRQMALDAYDKGDLGAFIDLNGQLTDMGRSISVADLTKRERDKLMKQMKIETGEPTYRSQPGEAEYAPTR